jgi:TolB protein
VELDTAASPPLAAPGGEPAAFAAPGWTSGPEHWVYALRGEPENRLVLAPPEGQPERDLLTYQGPIAFEANPRAPQVALTLAALAPSGTPWGPLFLDDYTADPATLTPICDRSVVAFFWSPDGQQLLYLTYEAPLAGRPLPVGWVADRSPLAWNVWDGQQSHRIAGYEPSPLFFNEYLRFFDQCAQSMTPWSPDSRSFVCAGKIDGGRPGVWVCAADGGGRPRRVCDGLYAAWSPK